MRERASEERPEQVFSFRAGALPASRFSRTVLRYGVLTFEDGVALNLLETVLGQNGRRA
jgi:hypothetical protein